jgi:hypothetical protein
MYNHSLILPCLRGLIGFERSYNADYSDLDDDLQASASGVYVNNGLHPLFTYDNITAIAEQFSKVTVKAWSNTATYKTGDISKDGADIYQSLQNTNLNHQPSASATFWKKTTLMSAYFRRLYDGAVLKLLNQLFTEKKINEVAKSIHANINLFEGVGSIDKRIVKNSRLVGLRLKVLNPDTVAMLNYIGMQVDAIQNPLTIYLYHSSSDIAVKTFTLNQTKAVQFQWHKITQEVLAFLNDQINAGGHYYLCYYEDDLTGSAIRKDISWVGKSNCGNCSEAIINSQLWNKWGKFIQIQPFYINSADIKPDKKLWDEEREIYLDDTNWGLNMQMSIQCDVTNFMCNNSNLFTDAMAKQLTVDILNEMAYSMRDNQKKEKLAGLAAVALDNQENGQYGEAKKLALAIKAISFDFSDLSAACLPCNNAAMNPRRTSVWGN